MENNEEQGDSDKDFDDHRDYQEYYDDTEFWEKIRIFFRKAGKELLLKALQLYFVMKHEETPSWAKTVALGALGYFICPFDAIVDLIPVFGFKDDFGVIMAAIITLNSYITEEIEQKALKKYKNLFDFSKGDR